MTREERKDKALAWANEIRAKYKIAGGRPLKKFKKGTPNSPNDCALACALRTEVMSRRVTLDYGHGALVEGPGFIDKFIGDFDDGKYPELVRSA